MNVSEKSTNQQEIKPKIVIFLTGGTIGADPYPDPKNPPQYVTFSEGMEGAKKQLEKSLDAPEFKNKYDITCENICAMDSKNFSNNYDGKLDILVNKINNSLRDRILVTCGTDAMKEIALNVQRKLDGVSGQILNKKTVIFTGAMIPIANGEGTDGYDNVKYSLECLAKGKSKGVFVCMNKIKLRPIVCQKDFIGYKMQQFGSNTSALFQRENMKIRNKMGLGQH